MSLAVLLQPIEAGPYSYSEAKGDGVAVTFPFSFVGPAPGYIRQEDIRPFIRVSDVNNVTYNTYTEIDYNTNPWVISGNQITFANPIETALDNENNLRIRRIMPKSSAYATTNVNDIFKKTVINNSFLQQLYSQHEVLDGFTTSAQAQDNLNMGGFRITNMERALDDFGATNLIQVREEIASLTEQAVADGIINITAQIQDDVAESANNVQLSADQVALAEQQVTLAQQAVSDAGAQASAAASSASDAQQAFTDTQALSDSFVLKVDNTTTSAMVLPKGTEAQKPPTLAETRALFRFTDGVGPEVFNPETGQWGPVGGGVTKPDIDSGVSINAEKNKVYGVDVSDDNSREIVIPAGELSEGEFIGAYLVGWTGAEGVIVTINPDNSYSWQHPSLNAGAKLHLGKNQGAIIQVVDGKLKVVSTMGENSYLTNRGPTVLYDDVVVTNGLAVLLTKSILLFDELTIYTTYTYLGETRNDSKKVTPDELLNADVNTTFTLLDFSAAASDTTNARVRTTTSTNTETSIRVTTGGTNVTSVGVYKVVGYKF